MVALPGSGCQRVLPKWCVHPPPPSPRHMIRRQTDSAPHRDAIDFLSGWMETTTPETPMSTVGGWKMTS